MIATLIGIAVALLAQPSLATDPLTILYSSDGAGIYEDCGCLRYPQGGLSRRATLIQSLNKDGLKPIVLDTGGSIFTSPPVDPMSLSQTRAKAVLFARSYAHMKYDAVLPGPSDLLKGWSLLSEAFKKAGVPLVLSNAAPQPSASLPVLEIKRAKHRIAILGFLDPEQIKGFKDGDRSITIQPVLKSLNARLSKIDKAIDLVIVMTYQGLSKDRELARKTRKLPLIIGAGSDDLLEIPLSENRSMIFQCASETKAIGRIQVTIKTAGARLYNEKLHKSFRDRIAQLKRELSQAQADARAERVPEIKALHQEEIRSIKAQIAGFEGARVRNPSGTNPFVHQILQITPALKHDSKLKAWVAEFKASLKGK